MEIPKTINYRDFIITINEKGKYTFRVGLLEPYPTHRVGYEDMNVPKDHIEFELDVLKERIDKIIRARIWRAVKRIEKEKT